MLAEKLVRNQPLIRAEAALTVWVALVIAASVFLWWPSEYVLDIPSDDTQLMASNCEILNGRWDQLLAPQDVHVVPLFRLIRLFFELNFPFRFRWLRLVALAAHAASTVLLFALSRQYLRTHRGALVVTALFAWQGLGGAAFIIKAHSTYVLSLPFLLGGLCCLSRLGRAGSRWWAAGCLFCLLAAIGLHSILGALAIPGVLLGYYLLARKQGGRTQSVDAAAWVACVVPFVVGCALWVFFCAPSLERGHRPGLPNTVRELLVWSSDAFRGAILHFGFLVRRAPPYYLNQQALVRRMTQALTQTQNQPLSFWIGWKNFFDQAAAGAVASSTEFRLPPVELKPHVWVAELLAICNPKGKPGIAVLPPDHSHPQDCENFWGAVTTARGASGPLERVALPSSLVIVDINGPPEKTRASRSADEGSRQRNPCERGGSFPDLDHLAAEVGALFRDVCPGSSPVIPGRAPGLQMAKTSSV